MSLTRGQNLIRHEDEVSVLLDAWNLGDESALDQLIPLVLQDLRDIARRQSRSERDGHMLQPTALVNELYLKLHEQRSVQWASQSEFFGVASAIVRRILIDYARARKAKKRGGKIVRTQLEEALNIGNEQLPDVIALDDSLNDLRKVHPRSGKIVELHVFCGLNFEEIAHTLHLSRATVMRKWHHAKLWLRRQMVRR